jgi:hypothetical protein
VERREEVMAGKNDKNDDLMNDILYGGKKRSGCKKKLRKCCTKNQLEATGKKKVKRCCCFPGGTNKDKDSETRGTEDNRRTESGKKESDRRGKDLDTRDIGDAMMGGLGVSIGGGVAGGIRG